MLILPEGAFPSRPRTLLGRMVGNTMAAPAVLRKLRRLMDFIGGRL
jgi:hypothetical protein